MDKRITDLEIKLAYQEHTIDALNQVIIRHEQDIEQLKAYIKILKNKLDELPYQSPATEAEAEPLPPHY